MRFGIPGLDGLFNNPSPNRSHDGRKILKPNFSECGISIPKAVTSSVCLIGPDGVGKSVFALHLAGRYAAECIQKNPKVFYISTDLNHDVAKVMWKNFALDLPHLARDPFTEGSGVQKVSSVELISCTADDFGEKTFSDPDDNVRFLDLAASTAGDDWAFLHRFISVLDKPKTDDDKHLIIIDAVEGFETYVGKTDAFGERTSRRARIAQVMRLTKGKAHVVLVVEESRTNRRLPEEFVTDVVIRLSKTNIRGYMRRTVEIEKARGQYYARGAHQYTIRNGKGSTTGHQQNADDPKFSFKREDGKPFDQSYVFLPESLNVFHRTIMERKGGGKPPAAKEKYASFGIEYLDNMLGGEDEQTNRVGGFDSRGLPTSTLTAIVGDTLSQKSRLGRAFLSQAFSSVADIYEQMANREQIMKSAERIFRRFVNILDVNVDKETSYECIKFVERLEWHDLIKTIQRIDPQEDSKINRELIKSKLMWLHILFKKLTGKDENQAIKVVRDWLLKNDSGVALMLTTYDITNTFLSEKFREYFESKYVNPEVLTPLQRYMEENTICRRIEIHDVSSSTMFNIFTKCIWEAQKLLLGRAQMANQRMDFDRLGRIRLVVDDFSTFRHIYPDITSDPLLMPSIKFLLGRAGVTALIVDTQTGKPDVTVAERFESELRQMVDNSLYTWRVPFYGENRVAITAIPPLSTEYAGIVRELRWETKREMSDDLSVDPHFEMYLGLEEGKTQPIALEVRLFADVPYFDTYLEEENLLLSEMFTAAKSLQGKENDRIIIKFPNDKYDVLRDMSYLQRDTRLDHTIIVSVDEFWGTKLPARRRSGSFRRQWSYLNAITCNDGQGNRNTDPYSLFQKGCVKSKKHESKRRRRYFFDDDLGYRLLNAETETGDEKESIERVPFSWDFGFLLVKKDAWIRAGEKNVVMNKGLPTENAIKVHRIWEKMVKIPEMKVKPEEADLVSQSATLDEAPLAAKPVAVSKKQTFHAGEREFDFSWRVFLDACKNVAEAESDRVGYRVAAFDSSLITPETFSCLFLEIWTSEIYNKLKKKDDMTDATDFFEGLSIRKWKEDKPQSLIDWLEPTNGHQMELYKTWLLLVDVFDFAEIAQDDFGRFEMNTRLAASSAVAVRLWYKTACHWVESNSRTDSIIAARLPGNFSVRGDWFLSIAGGSRSPRLAERAVDILCSRRANIVRLQQGIGLPTRYLRDNDKLRTRLVLNGEYGRPQNADYKEINKLGHNSDQDFYWLWRSNLSEYHRHSRAWHKWLNRVLRWWHQLKFRFEDAWDPGFRTYDLLTAGMDEKTRKGEPAIQKEFRELCDVLRVELENASSKPFEETDKS